MRASHERLSSPGVLQDLDAAHARTAGALSARA
jgi:hypothetical protein